MKSCAAMMESGNSGEIADVNVKTEREQTLLEMTDSDCKQA